MSQIVHFLKVCQRNQLRWQWLKWCDMVWGGRRLIVVRVVIGSGSGSGGGATRSATWIMVGGGCVRLVVVFVVFGVFIRILVVIGSRDCKEPKTGCWARCVGWWRSGHRERRIHAKR